MGRPEFSSPGTAGGGQTVATNEVPDTDVYDLSPSGSIAADETYVAEAYAPAGARIRVLAAYLHAPDTGSTNYMRAYAASLPDNEVLYANGTGITWQYGYWEDQTNAWPTDPVLQNRMLRALKATPSSPIQIEYENGSTEQTGLTLKLVVEEVSL